jgi:hypothetical protein
MAADLRGDLLGAQARVEAADPRWLGPLPLWSGILAGPVAWAVHLTATYALVKWVCATRHDEAFIAITLGALAVLCVGAALSWQALHHTSSEGPSDGGRPRQRARFMAVLGLTIGALFALQILAGAMPYWVLDACQ